MLNYLLKRACLFVFCAGFISWSVTATASVLGPMTPQLLEPGTLMRYPLQRKTDTDYPVEIKLGHAPEGAHLRVGAHGEMYVYWRSPDNLTGETLIEVIASRLDTSEKIESRFLLVRALSAAPVASDTNATQQASQNTQQKSEAADNDWLKPIEEQQLVVGKSWQLPIPVSENAPQTLQILAGGLPLGAFLRREPSGRYVIQWSPADNQMGSHVVHLRAYVAGRSEEWVSTQLPLNVIAPPTATTAEPDSASEAASTHSGVLNDQDDPSLPVFPPLANQVVSAGRIVTLRMSAREFQSNNRDKISIEIDRLPASAGFDRQRDGSYTFYWQTSDRDQGEHVFRFTAFYVMEPHLRVSREALIVVGDPTMRKTVPNGNL